MSNTKKNIYITTNETCNLRCTYCYEKKTGSKEVDVEFAKKQLFESLSSQYEGTTIVNFHGGEPFLVFEKIKEICEWLWSQDISQPYLFFATTNGTKVHGEIQEWLSKNKDRFIAGLSLDGTREMQNMNRSNSFDQIDIDFFAKTWPNQGVKMTVSPRSIETLADGIIFLHSVGIHNIIVNLAYMVNWREEKFSLIYQRELQKLATFYKENPQLKKDSIFQINFALLSDKDSQKRRWCGAGVESMAFDIHGDKYPCHLFFEDVCGKEKSQNWHNIDFSSPQEYISKECAECKLYATCPTCYGANYIERGSIGKRDMNLCRLEKIRVLEVAKFEYDRIVNSKEELSKLDNDEIYQRKLVLESLEKIQPLLLEIAKELSLVSK